MRRLIIGCGYVGRRAADAWSRRGDEITVLTRSPAHATEFHRLGWQPVLGDVTQPATVADLPAVDTVLYAVGLDRRARQSQRDVYVEGLRNVLDSPAARSDRFIYISSTSVYGQETGEWVDESSACEPVSDGGRVCLEAEQTLRREIPTAIILRLAGIYGPGRLIARVEALRTGEPLRFNPGAWLNLIHVDDAVAAILASDERATAGTIYLIADDRPNTRRQFYSQVASLVGAPAPRFLEQELPTGELERLNKRCANRRLRDDLGVELMFATTDVGLPASLRS
ncbi:MAG: SDR family oxidoreductase [Planctomycetales bacterium]|nr:SDR family oxidoreductase [Planctomycetales bacterium]